MPSKTEVRSVQLVTKIAQKFGLEAEKYLPVQMGYRNESHPLLLTDGRIVNIMLLKDGIDAIQIIHSANAVSAFSASNGLPARTLLDTRILIISSDDFRRFAVVYRYLPGETIAWEAYTQKHIKLLGKTLSDLHFALRDYESSQLPDVIEIYLQIVRRMKRYFSQAGVVDAVHKKLFLQFDASLLDAFAELLEKTRRLNNSQALHMDFVRGNILFSDSADGPVITGILDFEKTVRGNPLFDIARTLAFLLVDCKYKQPEKIRKYFLKSGYEKRGDAMLPNIFISFRSAQTPLLELLVDLFLLYDFYKFLRHNPYEFLHENEHFVRTREILLQRNLIFLAKLAKK